MNKPLTKLPEDDAERKKIRLWKCLFKYFPDALVGVAKLSYVANEQHNPGTEPHWDRTKSKDEFDSMLSHMLEAGSLDKDGIPHSAKVAWRALANYQKEVEEQKLSKAVDTVAEELKQWGDAHG